MGIPYYFYVISRKTPGILLSDCPQGCSHYYLDYNGVIHQAVNEILHGPAADADETPEALEQRMFRGIWDYTERCIAIVQPTQEVALCVDGVAPIAKMIQQRKRRYLSGFRARLDGEKVVWDRNAISPGTPFMTRLHAFLRAALRNRPATATGAGAAYISLSTSEEPGEGEHKIFQKIRGLAASDAPIIIHGLDADLIMLSLLSHTPHIYLMREPTHVSKDLAAGAAADAGPSFLYLSVDALRRALLTDLAKTFRWDVSVAARADPFSPDARGVIENYVALCFLLGNDFLPHPCTLSLKHGGHDRLLHAARTATEATGLTLIGGAGGGVVLDYLAAVFRELARDEETTLTEYTLKYLKRTPRAPAGAATQLAPSDFYPLRPENKDPFAEVLIGGGSGGSGSGGGATWNALYYKHLFHTRLHDTKMMTQACQRFVQGVEWTLRYYKKHTRDPFWYYPFGFAPTFRDLANYTAAAAATAAPGAGAAADPTATLPASIAPDGYVDPLLQLLCIMPPESAPILPHKVRLLMTVPTYGCTHMYPTNYPIQTFLKTHLWECHPVLPTLDLVTLYRALHAFGNTPLPGSGSGTRPGPATGARRASAQQLGKLSFRPYQGRTSLPKATS